MTLPVDTPQLPKWPFLLGDAVLLGTAWIIASQSRDPFSGAPLIAIVACVMLGALLGAIPFLSDYARKQDEALDERQRSLETLSRTVAASAEQISIAAGGLHEITEIAQRNLTTAEHLPHKLQEKIAEFKAGLENAHSDEREELEKELATLRAGESERLESTADKITKATAEFTRLEAAAQKHISAGADAMAKASAAAAQAAGNLQEKLDATLTQIKAQLAALESAAQSLKLPPAPTSTPAPAAPRVPETVPEKPEPASVPAAITSPVVEPSATPAAPVGSTDANSLPPEAQGEVTPGVSPAAVLPEPSPRAERKRAPRKPKGETPAGDILPLDAGPSPPSPPAPEPAAGHDESFQLAPEETPADPSPPEATESALAADGATRLLVTAYIGIGNRLFIRGDGPGLSWDKGVPLQFVSIGKWRWESADAAAAVTFKLYKNDELECAAVGKQTLEPGHQHELTATF